MYLTQMPNNIDETSLVFASLASSLFPNFTAASVGASLLVLAIACMVHRIWPMRLTYVLVAFMRETERLYYDAVEAGELPGDVDTEEKLLSLQTKVSEMREESLQKRAWKDAYLWALKTGPARAGHRAFSGAGDVYAEGQECEQPVLRTSGALRTIRGYLRLRRPAARRIPAIRNCPDDCPLTNVPRRLTLTFVRASLFCTTPPFRAAWRAEANGQGRPPGWGRK
ncbi:hypothetical protein C8J57DRAFT_1723201 [Mycena rebaudengoi]|nr:hypothetical protein C8J57DRAFT_1723201 [Mycena rebaudengoi]